MVLSTWTSRTRWTPPEEVPPVGRAVRPRRRIKEGDDFCISFTDADFARSSEPLAVEVTMEPARCVIDLSLVEETPTEAVLDTVQVDVGEEAFPRTEDGPRRSQRSLSDFQLRSSRGRTCSSDRPL